MTEDNTKTVFTGCALCYHSCGVEVTVRNGKVVEGEEQRVLKNVEETLSKAQIIRHVFDQKVLYVGSITFSGQDWFTTGMRKRKIVDKRSSMVLNGS